MEDEKAKRTGEAKEEEVPTAAVAAVAPAAEKPTAGVSSRRAEMERRDAAAKAAARRPGGTSARASARTTAAAASKPEPASGKSSEEVAKSDAAIKAAARRPGRLASARGATASAARPGVEYVPASKPGVQYVSNDPEPSAAVVTAAVAPAATVPSGKSSEEVARSDAAIKAASRRPGGRLISARQGSAGRDVGAAAVKPGVQFVSNDPEPPTAAVAAAPTGKSSAEVAKSDAAIKAAARRPGSGRFLSARQAPEEVKPGVSFVSNAPVAAVAAAPASGKSSAEVARSDAAIKAAARRPGSGRLASARQGTLTSDISEAKPGIEYVSNEPAPVPTAATDASAAPSGKSSEEVARSDAAIKAAARRPIAASRIASARQKRNSNDSATLGSANEDEKADEVTAVSNASDDLSSRDSAAKAAARRRGNAEVRVGAVSVGAVPAAPEPDETKSAPQTDEDIKASAVRGRRGGGGVRSARTEAARQRDESKAEAEKAKMAAAGPTSTGPSIAAAEASEDFKPGAVASSADEDSTTQKAGWKSATQDSQRGAQVASASDAPSKGAKSEYGASDEKSKKEAEMSKMAKVTESHADTPKKGGAHESYDDDALMKKKMDEEAELLTNEQGDVLEISAVVVDTEAEKKRKAELARMNEEIAMRLQAQAEPTVMALVVDDKDLEDEEADARSRRKIVSYLCCFIVVVVVIAVVLSQVLGPEAQTPFPTMAPTFPITARPTASQAPSPLRSDQPSDIPSSVPSSSSAPSDTPCFLNSLELKTAVDDYLQNRTRSTFVARTYGWPIRNWCFDGVTDFSELFSAERNPRAAEFDESLISWDVSSVKNMNSMFKGALQFNQDLSFWDTSNVEDMSFMFNDAISINMNLNNWDTSKVTTMESMFERGDFVQETQLDFKIKRWDVSKVTSMRRMFKGHPVNQDLSNWDVGNVVDMEEMFSRCSFFRTDLSGWNISKVRTFREMFSSSSYSQSLCAWGQVMREDADVLGMFRGSACPATGDPVLGVSPGGPFCQVCPEISASPTAVPPPAPTLAPGSG